jgi:DtxR family transcriptional regulator, Mn-dependent transcriptional regulator
VSTWKEYDQNIVTHSAAHHLMAIHQLIQRLGYARVSDVARQLNITRGSVSISLQPLKRAGLIIQDENRHLRLSEQGQALVDAIMTKRHVVQRLFVELLGVPTGQAEVDACKLEHLVSNETARRVTSFLRFLDERPPPARDFMAAWRGFDPSCSEDPSACATCDDGCLLKKTADDVTDRPEAGPPIPPIPPGSAGNVDPPDPTGSHT